MYDWFIEKVLSHPEWEKVRAELTPDDSRDHQVRTELGGGLAVLEGLGPEWTREDKKKSDMWGEICWYVNNGPGYCEHAPDPVKVYLKRVGAIQ